MMPHFLHALWITFLPTVVLAAILSVIPRLGAGGWKLSERICRAPLLDLVVACFTWLPWVIAAAVAGWGGFFGALAGQAVAMFAWTSGHELVYREAARGPRIVKFLNRTVGRWQNHAALWVTLVALPAFWMIRILQIMLFWTLPLLLKMPRYRQGDWVNVSRQKVDGLVGHDLLWCLYCDWMTGVYALGAEVLRNVESFWCPIRFYDGKKCANCAIDFPDVNQGWVAADKSMADVVAKMQMMYGDGRREWFGHPARLTVKGRELEPSVEITACAAGK
jgi:hypothetical protein